MSRTFPPVVDRAYTANPHYAEARRLYRTHIRDDLYPRLHYLTKDLMAHPQGNPRYVRLSLWQGTPPPMAFFSLSFVDTLVEDVLCSPDAVRRLAAGEAPMQILLSYAASPSTDLWTRDQATYILDVIQAGNASYDACASTLQLLGKHEAFALDCLQVTLKGGPARPTASKLTFAIQFSAEVPRGWFQCPGCGNQIPDLPTARSPTGRPLCFVPGCPAGVPLPTLSDE